MTEETKQPEVSKVPEAAKESDLNKFCRENKEVLWIGTRIGIYIGIMLILVMVTKMAVMDQVRWAEEQCSCQDWGGDAFTLRTQPKVSNISGNFSSGMGDLNGTTGQGGW